jgi:hypothetical protein
VPPPPILIYSQSKDTIMVIEPLPSVRLSGINLQIFSQNKKSADSRFGSPKGICPFFVVTENVQINPGWTNAGESGEVIELMVVSYK